MVKTRKNIQSTTFSSDLSKNISLADKQRHSKSRVQRRAYTRRWIAVNIKDEVKSKRRLKTLKIQAANKSLLMRMLSLLSNDDPNKALLRDLLMSYGNQIFSWPQEALGLVSTSVNSIPASLVEEIKQFEELQSLLKTVKPISQRSNCKMSLIKPELIKSIIRENNDFKLSRKQITEIYNSRVSSNETLSESTLFRHCKYLEIIEYRETRKKIDISYPLLSIETQLFLAEVQNFMLRFQNFTFVDEATIYPHDSDSKRWCLVGEATSTPKAKRLPSVKLIAGINLNGVVFFRVSYENTNQFVFSDFLKGLANSLRFHYSNQPNQEIPEVIVLDNASWHATDIVKQEVRTQKLRVLFLPPYSPSFNAIEMLFAYLKQELRRRKFETEE